MAYNAVRKEDKHEPIINIREGLLLHAIWALDRSCRDRGDLVRKCGRNSFIPLWSHSFSDSEGLMNPTVRKHLSQVSEGMSLLDETEIQNVIDLLNLVKKMGGTVWTIGNGGSAATASHLANDLLKMAGIKAVCLSDMVPVVTAYGNDNEWENMYGTALWKLFTKGRDCVVGITCSGNSENIVRAVEIVSGNDETAICLTGLSNGSKINVIPGIALIHARVPDIRVQEDLHMMVCHAIVRTLQEEG